MFYFFVYIKIGTLQHIYKYIVQKYETEDADSALTMYSNKTQHDPSHPNISDV